MSTQTLAQEASIIHNNKKSGNDSNVHLLIEEQNVVCSHSKKLFNNEKEWSTNTFYNLIQPMNLQSIMLSEKSNTPRPPIV